VTPSYHSTRKRHVTYSRRILTLLIAIVIASIGCAKSQNENATAAGGGHTAATASNANTATAASPQAPIAEGTPTSWDKNASSLNGKDGQTFTLACSAGGEAHNVWGSDIYTSDSSICTAAVHSGLITYQQGGSVTIELRAGRPIYGSSERNGVSTTSYGSYPQSFVFKTPNTDAVVKAAEANTDVLWNTAATIVPFEVGKTHDFKCPAKGRESTIWGTDIYTADSSICTAAVHAGKITIESGGPVTIELRPGESSYRGTTRNGIKSTDYGNYGQSFVVK